MLKKMDRSRFDSTLRKLFKVGNDRIDDLILALSDSDSDVKVNAQIVIRALGNEKGTKLMYEFYEKGGEFSIYLGSLIPLPLNEFEYEWIDFNFFNAKEGKRNILPRELYALILDNSEKSNQYLERINEINPIYLKNKNLEKIRKSFEKNGDLSNTKLRK